MVLFAHNVKKIKGVAHEKVTLMVHENEWAIALLIEDIRTTVSVFNTSGQTF